MIIDSPIISGSYAATGSLNQVGNVVITGSLTVTGQITGSINTASYADFAVSASHTATSISSSFAQSAISASNALTASYLSNYIAPFPYTGSADISGSLSVNGNITSNGTLTAQTLVVQVITSSVDFVTGSTRFGSLVANTHQFTGSVTISGSLAVNDSTAILTNQTGAMSVATASYVANAVSASFSQTAISASFAASATSASYALTASYASNVPATSSFAVSASVALNAISASYITGSNVIGTVASATSASFSQTAISASYANNVPATSSFSVSASQAQNAVSAAYSAYALTSSYSLAGSGFPFSGSAVITGSLLITNLSSSGVSYLVADSTGFITAQTASAAIKSTQAVTSTAGQTSFNITNGYTTGLVDVYINGTKLSAVEYTDTSGTVITLATGSNSGDTVEFVKYFPASGVTNNALRQSTTFTASAAQTVFSASYTPGLLDIYYNGSHLSNGDFTANNGTFFTLATGSAAGDILDVFVYSYQVGAFSGIGGAGVASQVAYFDTTNAITGSPNFTIIGSTMTITGSLIVSGSGTFTNIGPSIFSGSVTALQGFSGSFSGTATNSSLLNGSGSGEFVPTGSFNTFSSSILTYTGSANSRLGSIETITGSNITRIGALEVTSGSNITRLGALEVASGSAITRLNSIETVTGSNITRLNSLESKTGSYATTGSNTFIGTQTISGSVLQSGSFTTTGTIIAQTINVQTVTSSIIYSSGSNIFGNLLGDSQTFTGSVLITGSLTIAGASSATSYSGTTIYGSSVVCSAVGKFSTCLDLGGVLTGTSATFSGNLNLQGAVTRNINFYDSSNTNINAQIQYDQIASNSGQLFFGTNNAGTFATRLTIASTGAATFSSSVTATTLTLNTTTADYAATITNVQDSSQGLLIRATDNDTTSYILNLQSSNTTTGQTWVDRFGVTKAGSVGINVSFPRSLLEVSKTTGNTSIGVASNFNLLLSQGGAINEYSQIGLGYTQTNSPAVIGYITTCATDYTKGSLIFATRDAVTDTTPTERMRICSNGFANFACELTAKTLGTNDLLLNNLNYECANYVDGTRGSWLIQEGACDLFIINQMSCKKYKFNLIEIK